MWKTWFFDAERDVMEKVIEILKKYDFKKRFISHEKVNSDGELKPHYHILCEMESVKPWNAMTAQILRDFKLKEKTKEERKKRGQTGRGGYCAYGIYKKDVLTPETFARYIAKDGDIWGDVPNAELQKIMEEGKKNTENRNWNDKLCQEISAKPIILRFNNHDRSGYYYNDKMLKVEIIKLYRKYEVVCSKIKIENSFNYIAQMSKNHAIRMTDDELLEYFYG